MSRFDNEPFTLSRDVDAVIVPAGINVKLRTGQSGFITQALGGSFTVYVEGNLFRIANEDAEPSEEVHVSLAERAVRTAVEGLPERTPASTRRRVRIKSRRMRTSWHSDRPSRAA